METSRATGVLLLALLLSCLELHVAGYTWPSPQVDALEQLIYEGTRNDGQRSVGALDHCTIVPPHQTTVAATWLRAAFHDASTFNITDGTGGLDASIYYEAHRKENAGMPIALAAFATSPSKYVSKADVIAIGAGFAVADCGGPAIPLSGGRVDAKGPGRLGVPQPHESLSDHKQKFVLQGFNSTEMIELVACGHTLGGVSSKDFPKLVAQPPPPVDGPLAGLKFPVSAAFDSTPAFDNTVVTEYLSRSTANVLVVGPDMNITSDQRIFNSDGDVTMKTLVDPQMFRSRCTVLIERMLHNVPSGSQLTPRITVLPEKPRYAGLRIINGTLTLFATLRLARPENETFVDATRISLLWCDRYGDNADCRSGKVNKLKGATKSSNTLDRSPIAAVLGLNFRMYHFQAPIEAVRSVSQFWWEMDDGTSVIVYDNGGAKYPILQDQIIYPSAFTHILSSLTVTTGSDPRNWHFLVAGVRDDISPTRVYATVFDNTHADKRIDDVVNATIEFVQNSTLPSAPGYTLYSSNFLFHGRGPTVDLHVDVEGGKTSTLDYQAVRSPVTNAPPDPHADVPIGTPTLVDYRIQGGTLSMVGAMPCIFFISIPALLAMLI